MKLYRLGILPWAETQAIYHALAEQQQEGLVICRPAGRCVCLGLHDDLQQEVNINFCREQEIPIIRRDIGGGMVLLTEEQIFFQMILRADNPLLIGPREAFFAKFLEPAIKTLADFSIKASVKLPADIVVQGKKISGNGAGDIHGFSVYTGNILFSFDRTAMANVLHVPSSRFREQVRLSMERYLTTMSEELGYMPDSETVEQRLVHHFAAWLNLVRGEYTPELKAKVRQIILKLTSDEFLNLPGKRTQIRQVKINEGTYVRLHPFPKCSRTPAGQNECNNRLGGPCPGYAILVVQNNKIIDIEIHGLSCLEPYNVMLLTAYLTGIKWNENDVRQRLEQWLQTDGNSAMMEFKETVLNWLITR